jgi:HKD family nuclease
MDVSILSSPEKWLKAIQSLGKWADRIELAYAWVSTNGGTSAHWKALPLNKITRVVVGTQFAQTEPWALRELDVKTGGLKVIIDSVGTFHPKVMVGCQGERVRAVVGSANLTSAAFSKNAELGVVLNGKPTDEAISDIIQFIDRSWERATPLDHDWLERYTLAWKRRPRPTGTVPLASAQATGIEDLEISWDAYFRLIDNQEGRRLNSGYRLSVFDVEESYLTEIESCQAAFRDDASFSRIPVNSRKLIAGLRPHSSGLLGSMKGAGFAKNIVSEQPELLAEVLDQIPLAGAISKEHALSAVESLTAIDGIALGVATRLLATKRPDVFLSLNGGSRPNIAALCARGAPSNARSYVGLLTRIWDTPWWRSLEPTDSKQRRVWNARVALLDSALYEEVERPTE